MTPTIDPNSLGRLCVFADWKLSTCRPRNRSLGRRYRCTIWPRSGEALAAHRGMVSETGNTPHEAIRKCIAKANGAKSLRKSAKTNRELIDAASKRLVSDYMRIAP